MTWTKPTIARELKRLYKSRADLSYNAMCRRKQSLVSASAYHYGSYRTAVARAGINYDEVCRRPRWTKQQIIALIKQARRKGTDLHWSGVTKRSDELGRAAFASVQPRLFGSWARALHAAGLDSDDVSIYRSWDPHSIAFELRERHSDGDSLSCGAIQKDDPGLYAAALRHFGSYDAALKAARLNPSRVRERQHWDEKLVIAAIRQEKRKGRHLSDSRVRSQNPALYGAAVRHFGSFSDARRAAGVSFKRGRANIPR